MTLEHFVWARISKIKSFHISLKTSVSIKVGFEEYHTAMTMGNGKFMILKTRHLSSVEQQFGITKLSWSMMRPGLEVLISKWIVMWWQQSHLDQ